MTVRTVVVLLLASLAFAGCSTERHWLTCSGQNQAVRAESGDRFFMDLDESDGSRWTATCADSDVSVTIERSDGEAEVTIRVHRGYDGPSVVYFACKRPHERKYTRRFAVTLFKRTGDTAFWE